MSKINYFRINFSLASPLSVGSGENVNTDSDIILDSRNKPVIPASSIAGIIHHFLEDTGKCSKDLWGSTENGDSISSRIRFYDAVPVSDCFVTVRDSVALENKISGEEDEGELLHNKVGISGSKFDKEAVETTDGFVTLIEIHNASEEERKIMITSLSAINSGMIRIGSKTTRGYGQLKVEKLREAYFSLPDDREKWLAFDQFNFDSDICYNDITDEMNNTSIENYADKITLTLIQKGAVSIRSYTVKDIADADYVQLSDKDGNPVIPGTSWAGAFRSRFKELSGNRELTNELFGFVDTVNNKQQRSKVFFSESRITGGTDKTITRTSIDRFSAGVKTSALYSEKTHYNGKCTLEIVLLKSISEPEKCKALLSAVLCDLNKGYLAVGGLTSVGRGIFEIQTMLYNGKDVSQRLIDCDILNMMGDDVSE